MFLSQYSIALPQPNMLAQDKILDALHLSKEILELWSRDIILSPHLLLIP